MVRAGTEHLPFSCVGGNSGGVDQEAEKEARANAKQD